MRGLCGQISDDLMAEEGLLWVVETTLQSSQLFVIGGP